MSRALLLIHANGPGAFIYGGSRGIRVVQGAQSVPQWYAATARRTKVRTVAGMAVVFAGFFVFMFGTVAAAVTGIVHPVLMAMLGFGLIIAGGVTFAFASPEPASASPAIKAPAVLEAKCPNCGASLHRVDRDGVATCEYCESQVLLG